MRAYQFGGWAPDRSRHQFHVCALVHPDKGVLQGTNMNGVLRPQGLKGSVIELTWPNVSNRNGASGR